MKIYEIYDEEMDLSIGTLIYFEKSKSFVIELEEYLDEWTAPLLFTSFVKKGIFTILNEFSLMWVRERIIPSGRQNIGAILSNHKLKEYDEMKFLEISEGRCCQDSMYIRKIEQMPDYVVERAKENVTESIVTADDQLLCFFEDNTIKKVNITNIAQKYALEKVVSNKRVLESVKVGPGGYSIVFNDVIELSARILYLEGAVIPLLKTDFDLYIKKNVLDTSESCELLRCTRQNLAYMVKEEQVNYVKENVKGNLYLKGDIVKNIW